MALIVSPGLLYAWYPGKYVFRKPADGSSNSLVNRMRQFRIDHPGIDGTIFLSFLAMLALVAVSGAVIGLGQSLSARQLRSAVA